MAKIFDVYLYGKAKELDVYLSGKEKEFDVYLGNRTTECDIFIYSIPYRDCLSIIHKLILDSNVDSYTLQKFISAKDIQEIEFKQVIEDTLKTSFDSFVNSLDISIEVSKELLSVFEKAEFTADMLSDLTDLLYHVYTGGTSDLQITASVTETEILFSLGQTVSDMQIDVQIDGGEFATKYESADTAVEFIARLSESIRQFAAPTGATIDIKMIADAIVRRYRLLQELDSHTLLSLDSMTLEDLDYVVVDITPVNTSRLGTAKLGVMRLGR